MKKKALFRLIIVLAALVILNARYDNASARFKYQGQPEAFPAIDQQAAQTPLPTAEPIIIGYPTPEARTLPPVGSNAGLVIGASVLVLIIIGGVLSARLRSKH